MKRAAICFRGLCSANSVHWSGRKKSTNYKKTLSYVKDKIITPNKDYDFDVYAHGWIDNEHDISKIKNDFPGQVKCVFEKQKDFKNDYVGISDYQSILRERYVHLHKKNQYTYDDINFLNYFQNIHSYAYSISKTVDMISPATEYDYIIHLRYDIKIHKDIILNDMDDNLVYTDHVGSCQSPLFCGDFIYVSNKSRGLFWKNFYNFLKTEIFNNDNYKQWVDDIRNKKPSGRIDHGIYSNQMIYSYYLNRNNVCYNDMRGQIKASI
jgi:hypothetical protein